MFSKTREKKKKKGNLSVIGVLQCNSLKTQQKFKLWTVEAYWGVMICDGLKRFSHVFESDSLVSRERHCSVKTLVVCFLSKATRIIRRRQN